MACSLSRQFFFSWAMAGSWNVTPPCRAIPSQTCSTLSTGTPSATGIMSCAPSASAAGKIMFVFSVPYWGYYNTRSPRKQQAAFRRRGKEVLTAADSPRYGSAAG